MAVGPGAKVACCVRCLARALLMGPEPEPQTAGEPGDCERQIVGSFCLGGPDGGGLWLLHTHPDSPRGRDLG
eukprot:8472304-Lingulodinium_polyedra.AAC.1